MSCDPFRSCIDVPLCSPTQQHSNFEMRQYNHQQQQAAVCTAVAQKNTLCTRCAGSQAAAVSNNRFCSHYCSRGLQLDRQQHYVHFPHDQRKRHSTDDATAVVRRKNIVAPCGICRRNQAARVATSPHVTAGHANLRFCLRSNILFSLPIVHQLLLITKFCLGKLPI